MAYSAGISDRHDDMRYRSAQSPRDETFTLTSPLRSIGSQMSNHNSGVNDARGSLQRRFTTNTVPTLPTLSPLSPIGQQRRQAAEQPDYTTATFHKVQLLEKKKLEYEYLREQRRRFEAEMELLDRQARREEDEMHRLASDLTRGNMPGRQSEPTTPPEYRDSGFPNAFSKPNRYSSASITSLASPPGLSNRPSRSGSQITHSHNGHSQSISHIPSKSMPGSRRNSDEEEEDDYDDYELSSVNHRAAAALNRKSMPVTGYDLTSQRVNSELPDLASVLGHIDTTKFLFDDQEDKPVNHHTPVASPDRRSFLHMNTTNDKDNFPILIRREDNNTMQYSALDSATEQSPSTEPQSQTGWSSFASRHRQSQSSLPMNNLHQQLEDLNISSPVERTEPSSRNMAGPGNSRRSSDLKFSPFGQSNRASAHAAQNGSFTMPKLQSSFSTNDIPTVKNPNGINGGQGAITPSTANSHAENHYHNHNASIGRIPTGVPSNRQSRDLTATTTQAEEQRPVTRQSALHASAAPFNSGVASPTNAPAAVNATPNSAMMGPYGAPAFFGGYGMNMMNQQIVPQQGQWAQGAVPQMYQNPYTQYGPTYQAYAAGGRFNDSQPRVIQSRRTAGQEQNRFQDFDLDTQRNEILALCKDQYGCRFLQKKLEERNEDFTLAIFEETKDAVIELMTDPFGNYLCQKLLEYTKDDQRTVLIKNAAPSMVGIALNQHGTRALQKMIEYILNAEQISTIIEALQSNVVALIQDLNGNHVIQKCLNHLKPQDAQFIFSAVGNNCVEVGTHRHGCCVLQRCIDHASGDQKNMLIHQISESSIKLVQDPFGNYVVQYILDLAEQKFTHPLCVKFMGRVVELSKQKFSSNVIEKCIRVAAHEIKRVMIDEILLPGELEGVMRDPYANYVIQTALDYADNDTCIRLIDAMRPIIPGIRQTPYGRRIQTKIQDREARLAQGSGPALIDPQSLATSPMTSPHASQAVPYNPNIQSPQNPYVGLANGYQSPQRIGNPTQPGFQNSQHQSFGRAAASYGMNGGNMNSNAGGMGNNMGYF